MAPSHSTPARVCARRIGVDNSEIDAVGGYANLRVHLPAIVPQRPGDSRFERGFEVANGTMDRRAQRGRSAFCVLQEVLQVRDGTRLSARQVYNGLG